MSSSLKISSHQEAQDHQLLHLEKSEPSSSIHPPQLQSTPQALSSHNLKHPQSLLDERSTSSHPSHHQNHRASSNLSNLQVDYVIVFSLLPIEADHRPLKPEDETHRSEQDERSYHTNRLIDEYQLLIQRLKSAGLSVTSRPGSKSSNELLILVTAHNETRIKQEIQAERIADWLHGITSIKPHSDLASSFLSQPYSSADRLRHLYNIITRDVQPDQTGPSPSPMTAHPHRPLVGVGAGIIPGQAPFHHVKSIFPPHDITFNRTWLSKWSDRSHLTIKIPEVELDMVKEIYGESIGYYFAFLNFYFQALVLPTASGVLFWLIGIEYSSAYAIILTLWSIAFLETWKIKERLLAIKWNSFNCHKVEKKRVEFIPEKVVKHFVTNEPVGYFPWWKREARKFVTIPVFVLFAIGISALITVITAIELAIAEVYTGPFKKALALLPTVLFTASVPQLVGLWQSTAVKLSNWENHSYNSSYDRSLTHKVFLVQGLVAYAGLILTAFIYVPFGTILVPRLAGLAHTFIKQESVPLDGSPDLYLNVRALDFSTYSINMARLYEQLFAYQVTNQLVDTFNEVGLPYIIKIALSQWNKLCDDREEKKKNQDSQRHSTTSTSHPSSSHHPHNISDEPDEHELLERLREEAKRPEYRLFVEYAEMAIQFGYIVLWTLIWPISPLFSFVNNFFELRTDAIKLIKHSRRPIPTRCDSIGPWVDVMSTLCWLSVIINAMLVHLFKPSGQQSEEGGLLKSTKMIVADLFPAAFIESNYQTGLSDSLPERGIKGGTAYDRLSPILLSILIPVLVSEHGFFLLRSIVRDLIRRLMWKNSEAELVQQRAEWELKQTFIERLEVSSQLDSSINDYFCMTKGHSGSERVEDETFWSREDVGLEEIRRLSKLD